VQGEPKVGIGKEGDGMIILVQKGKICLLTSNWKNCVLSILIASSLASEKIVRMSLMTRRSCLVGLIKTATSSDTNTLKLSHHVHNLVSKLACWAF
jgi:hypothetical protein